MSSFYLNRIFAHVLYRECLQSDCPVFTSEAVERITLSSPCCHHLPTHKCVWAAIYGLLADLWELRNLRQVLVRGWLCSIRCWCSDSCLQWFTRSRYLLLD